MGCSPSCWEAAACNFGSSAGDRALLPNYCPNYMHRFCQITLQQGGGGGAKLEAVWNQVGLVKMHVSEKHAVLRALSSLVLSGKICGSNSISACKEVLQGPAWLHFLHDFAFKSLYLYFRGPSASSVCTPVPIAIKCGEWLNLPQRLVQSSPLTAGVQSRDCNAPSPYCNTSIWKP